MEDNDKDVDNYKEDNDDKGISALGLDIVLGFSLGHLGYQGHRPHDDNDDEYGSEVKDNDKDDNNDKGISALGLYRPVFFARTSRILNGIDLLMTTMRRVTMSWRITASMRMLTISVFARTFLIPHAISCKFTWLCTYLHRFVQT